MGPDPLVSGSNSNYHALRPTVEWVQTHWSVGPNQSTQPLDPLVNGSRPTGEWVQTHWRVGPRVGTHTIRPTGEWVQTHWRVGPREGAHTLTISHLLVDRLETSGTPLSSIVG